MDAGVLLYAATIAAALADGLDESELNRLGAFVTAVGDQISLLAACSADDGKEE